MQVSKWGNSLAVRLPAGLAQSLGIKEGDEINLVARDLSAAVKTLEVERKPTRQELIESLRELRGTIPPDFKFNRDEANAR